MKLTMRHCESMGDWYVIERAEHDGRQWMESTTYGAALMCSSRFSPNADVEGNKFEMLAIADAIEKRSRVSFKRCSVHVDGDRVGFSSPRNSEADGFCSLAEADALAVEIRAALAP